MKEKTPESAISEKNGKLKKAAQDANIGMQKVQIAFRGYASAAKVMSATLTSASKDESKIEWAKKEMEEWRKTIRDLIK